MKEIKQSEMIRGGLAHFIVFDDAAAFMPVPVKPTSQQAIDNILKLGKNLLAKLPDTPGLSQRLENTFKQGGKK